MYQPYPSGGQMPDQPQRPAAPPPVLMAVKLMYAGAVLSALGAIYTAATAGGLKTAILKGHPLYTTAQVHKAETSIVITAVEANAGVSIALGVLVWIAGLGAIILLWRGESSQYMAAASAKDAAA